MSFRTTYILFGILLAVLGVFALTQVLGVRDPKEKGNWVFPSLNDKKKEIQVEDIETVEVERTSPKAEKLVFYRSDKNWRLKEPNSRVDNFQVDNLVRQIKTARPEAADTSANLKEFGLDESAATVTLKQRDSNKTWTLRVGRESVTGTEASKVVYVLSSDRKRPVAVKRLDLDGVFKGAAEFRARELLAAGAFNTEAFTLERPGKDSLAVEKSGDNRWRFKQPATFGEADFVGDESTGANPDRTVISGVRDLLGGLGGLRVENAEDFVADGVADADLAATYGLEKGKPESFRALVKRRGDGGLGDDKAQAVEEVLLVGKKVTVEKPAEKDDKGVEKKPAEKKEYYYARLENERAVVRVPAKGVESLLAVLNNPEVIRNRDLVASNANQADAVDVKNAAGLIKLRKAGEPPTWKLVQAGALRGADDPTVANLLTTLAKPRLVKGFPNKTDAEMGLDSPGAPQVSIWVDGVQKDEKKEDKKEEKKEGDPKEEKKEAPAEPKLKSDKPTYRLTFGKSELGVVYVKRESGDDVARVIVPDALLATVGEGALTYLDRSLPSFVVTNATKLVVVRDGKTLEVEQAEKAKDDKSPPQWKIKQPEELAGRNADTRAVELALGDLSRLRPDKFLAETKDPAALDGYGLKTPAVKATVTLKTGDKTEERAYHFGKETPDKKLHAQQGERDLVFLVQADYVASLKADMQDPTVWQLDPAKVKAVKLTGWKPKLGFLLTIELERQADKTWTAKQPPNFTVNNSVVEKLVVDLASIRADGFTPPKSGVKPEHKLGDSDRQLFVELTLEDGKKHTLAVGDQEPKDKRSYFAQSSALEDVFHLPLFKVQKLLDDGPKFFNP